MGTRAQEFELLTQILIWFLCTITCEHLRNKEEARPGDVGPGLYMEPKVNIIKYGLFDNLSQSWKEQRGPKKENQWEKRKERGHKFYGPAMGLWNVVLL